MTWLLLGLSVAAPLTVTTPVSLGSPPGAPIASVGTISGIVLVLLAVVATGVLAWVRTPRLDFLWDRALEHKWQENTEAVAPGAPVTIAHEIRRIRLGIINRGQKTVRNCRVRLMEFTPQGATFLPRPLRLDSKDVDTFDVDPGYTPQELIRVIEARTSGPGSDVLEICYADNSPRPLKKGTDYIFTLALSGEDHPLVTRRYVVHTYSGGEVTIYPHKAPRVIEVLSFRLELKRV